uniref:laminin subunit gamma-1-like n=1 Tax=Styela clava TaxID=7725 RepID=UPI00193A9908|nr:laminin subunit gamma-1-like [Styela clava]
MVRLKIHIVVACFGILGPALVNCMSECYNPKTGDPQVCIPPFVNAAFGKVVEATNTCGQGGKKEQYCLQTGVTGVNKSCHYCYERDSSQRHDAFLLTDINDERRPTWWQSQTMLFDVQHPAKVNLTLELGKAFDITYVRLKFHSSRPESFTIYKKTCSECDWVPYQFYSGTCYSTYGLDNKDVITVDDEKKALCTEDYSDISPLTGGNVAFSTLEGRPSAYNFDNSIVLQEWVTAVAIRISLNRINTFGDEVFSDSKVLKSYYYAISDFAVGGRCKCNGHASECIVSDTGTIVCVCEHNTMGDDCQLCEPLYNDVPWRRGGDGSAHECQKCDCNGLSDKCVFDPDLYRNSGHGGRCVECHENTAGVHCELCLPNHYREASSNGCVACGCSITGSVKEQCDANGVCTCKPGVGGDKCDQCLPGFFGLSEAGCSMCQCSAYGTEAGTVCDPVSGDCVCKLNVEGTQCDRCKPGTMNLQYDNPYGCTACFCYGHSSICEVAGGYTVTQITSSFDGGEENWRGVDARGTEQASLSWSGDGKIGLSGLYFSAPAKYLGEQRYSYNQFLEFVLSVDSDTGSVLEDADGSGVDILLKSAPRYGHDLIIEGDQYRVSLSLNDQNNPAPSSSAQVYRYRLHEAAGFRPRLSAFQFQKMLNDIKSIRIRAIGETGWTHLHSVQLDSAELGGNGPHADWIEYCQVDGYLDGFAESCAPGYTRAPANGGKYSPCVPCECNGHGTECHPETGVCVCLENTAGDHCEICMVGYYKKNERCVPCPCPNEIACAPTDDGNVKCLSCPDGHYGNHCEFCMDGWFGDPLGLGACQRCSCNGNIDPNSIMNCDRITGECLKCIYNTTGVRCERCLDGYYGQPVTDDPAQRCRACECFPLGSHAGVQCDRVTGQCSCLPNVVGKHCDQCQDGYWDIKSGSGCQACGCNSVGATTGKCDQDGGQCDCLPGVTGQRCDHCMDNYFNLSRDGCTFCECSPVGSSNLQCNEDGRCVCKDGVLGMKCDQCQENYYDISSGCIECPPCYGLVQDAVNTHRGELDRLSRMVNTIGDRPVNGGDDFVQKLYALNRTLVELNKKANDLTDKRNDLNEKVNEVNDRIRELVVKVATVENNVDSCASRVEEANHTSTETKKLMDKIDDTLETAKEKLDKAMDYIIKAKEIALESLSKENNMTKLADEADALADQHEQESESIVSTAQKALDTSNKALSSIQDAITTLNDLIDTFDDMTENRLPNANALRDELIKLSGDVLDKTAESKANATDLLTEAQKLAASMPSYNTEELDIEASNIIARASKLVPDINDLNDEYMDGHLQLQANIDRAETLLGMADAMQDTTDMLTAQAHSARETAKDAVEKGDAAYQSLLDIQKSLEAFYDQIEDNRQKATEAMEGADDINATIASANAKTAEAQAALGSARKTAQQARGKAQNAQSIAEDIQTRAAEIRADADDSYGTINDVSNTVNDLAGEVRATKAVLDDAAAKTDANADAVDEATADAANAKSKATNAEQKVNDVLAKLRQLLLDLDNLPDLNEDDIAELERELQSLIDEVEDADVQSSIDALQIAVDSQAATLENYDREMELLRADVENLRQIDATLPVGCFSDEAPVEQP